MLFEEQYYIHHTASVSDSSVSSLCSLEGRRSFDDFFFFEELLDGFDACGAGLRQFIRHPKTFRAATKTTNPAIATTPTTTASSHRSRVGSSGLAPATGGRCQDIFGYVDHTLAMVG